jgi:uncharacterized protein YndB with AHSA1/START domain
MKKQLGSEKEFTLKYNFNAPRRLVFNAFSDAKALGEWWGPVESKTTVIKLDYREGGIFHYRMETHGKANFGRFLFKKIVPYHTLEFTNAFADEHANVVPAPFDLNLPLEIFYKLKFTESGGITTIDLYARPVDADDSQYHAFNSISDSMVNGFNATFDKLKLYVGRLTAS